jgi:DNA repair protein RecN (Recombination protein N)
LITTLAIKNYALIDDLRVDFHDGLSIITGETGAGKSILLGALGLLLGKRAELASVKDATKKCIIEGEFAIKGHHLESIFETNNLDFDVDSIIRREILPGGKTRAFVNDTPVTLLQLQAIGPYLVDVHSQFDTQSLSQESFQIEVIDALANNEELLESFKDCLRQFKTVQSQLDILVQQKDTASKELDYNTFLLSELKEGSLQNISQNTLEEELEMLTHSEEITEALSQALQFFSDEQAGTLETAKEARISFGKLRNYGSMYDQLWERLNSVIIELEDIAETTDAAAQKVEVDPKRLFAVNDSLQKLYKLQKKHMVSTVEELLQIETELEQKILQTENIDEDIKELQQRLEEERNKTMKIGVQLHAKRAKAIPKLTEKLQFYLEALGLPNATFVFQLEPLEDFKSNGLDVLSLLFSANKGGNLGPLKKVASGGELSRIMLAVKAILAQYRKLPALVFDEIDTGVSGEIANKMAAIMSEMSETMQVISITHLPQIAAKGMQHFKVYKEDVNDITVTRLKALTGDERIVEIAQMIGGNNITDAAIANAKELLN